MNEERKLQRIWMPKASGTLYPMTQIPPAQYKLEAFAWFDNLRPVNGADVMNWRGKAAGMEMKKIVRHSAPVQRINANGGQNATGAETADTPVPAAADPAPPTEPAESQSASAEQPAETESPVEPTTPATTDSDPQPLQP